MPDQLEQVGGLSSGVRFNTNIYYLQFPIYVFPNCSAFSAILTAILLSNAYFCGEPFLLFKSIHASNSKAKLSED